MATLGGTGESVSVALCTCNGSAFLGAQLESLLGQTQPPDELVICDDASEDATYSILEAFAGNSPFPIRLHRNPERIGIRANFEQAIRLCNGDVIALCDQDDVWLPDKLERFVKLFATGADWVCCDAEVTDATLRSLGYTFWERMKFDQREQVRAQQGQMFEVLLKHTVVAGATLAFKAQARELLLPIPHGWLYDAWLAAVLAATGKAGLAEAPLQRYRQHGGNALGATQRSLSQEARMALMLDRQAYYAEEIVRWKALAARLASHAPRAVREQTLAKIGHLRRRAALPISRPLRIPGIAGEVLRGGYKHYARNWGSIALDLFGK